MHLPKVPFITKKTKSFLKWKTLLYLSSLKEGRSLFYLHILKIPKLFFRFLFSFVISRRFFKQENDYFLYGISCINDLKSLCKKNNTVLVIGFSYCQKPLRCPVGRFNDQCLRDPSNFACKNCIIGKTKALSSNSVQMKIIIIPTFLYLAKFLCTEKEKNCRKEFIFLITACELSFRMFGTYVSILNLKGIGVRLKGRICNTFSAFKLAERGIKPGLTVLDPSIEENFKRLLSSLMNISFQKEKESPK